MLPFEVPPAAAALLLVAVEGHPHDVAERAAAIAGFCQELGAAPVLAHELELDGEHCRLLRVVERVLNNMPGRPQHPLPLNIDGAIAAVCGDLGRQVCDFWTDGALNRTIGRVRRPKQTDRGDGH